jgi:cell division protein FtsW (lipid II flippase)
MRIGRVQFGTAFAIFVIFFGLALLEALRVRDWIAAALWLGAGLAFLVADNLRRAR